MKSQIKGKCKYCGKEYTKSYMFRHLTACKERHAQITAETNIKKCKYFELAVYGKYDNDYWLILEIREDATLLDLDVFLRDIWLECCGHCSAFTISGIRYYGAAGFYDEFDDSESMNIKLKKVLQTGMKIQYEYDFGSTTNLCIDVHGEHIAHRKAEKLTLLSRNNPFEVLCSSCHKKPATVVCSECFYSGDGFLCDDCKGAHPCGEDVQLPVCNSPRVGVCGYTGSTFYPDQFVPDTRC